jgi:hypothetical protein
MFSMLAIRMFEGSDPAEGDAFLTAIRIRNTPSFGGEVKSSVSCTNLRHIKPLKPERA